MIKMNKTRISDKKFKELARYGFGGLTTTILNLAIYQFGLYAGIYYRYVNLCAILVSKLYAYIVNKKLVFHSHCNTFLDLLKEIVLFILTRGFTGLIDYFGLICLVDILSLDKRLAKYVIQVIVIILNYFLGKHMVFRKNKLSMAESAIIKHDQTE